MDKYKQTPGSAFDDLSDQLGKMIDEMKGRTFFRFSSGAAWEPSLNLYETEDCYVACVDIAGMNGDEIEVNVEMRVLILSGKRQHPCMPDFADMENLPETLRECSVHLMEIETGDFRREVDIPGDVNIGNITANYHHGFLWIVMPKQ